ncbi:MULTISPECIES: cytochrome b [unclassified Pseudomonas]|uniref:cytochrome b n=1 Tax=unclassified Pseudomonas TaxID=196821 RepID=UPI000BCFF1E2|nr:MULTISPECIES: cytochrome b [unclassified Pseudomonas]PVZ15555.1 cytochrome b561 [Pseudomonas sp. URIL14HWK12:I12]PVZ24929.1 cytochrome b561 [Pseudomonas sp. URIL14HWK12:I10]PVZ34775.1 cytochrome b561 [Pseudomonas sp. URIL14HWK12:I11]SNZ09261.1 cytochrome b561 [Pseudomonas sp. URIL14HWK12:I9]
MQLKNSPARYGAISLFLHWGTALTVFGMFALGLWMVGLGYYDPWRKAGPDLHKSIGLTLFFFMLLRVVWRFISAPPPPTPNQGKFTRLAAAAGHLFLYVDLFLVMITGYLISTADGVGIPVFGLFEVPALFTGSDNQAEVAGTVHLYLAWALVSFAVLHGLAALKHHFIDRDATLIRMLGRKA